MNRARREQVRAEFDKLATSGGNRHVSIPELGWHLQQSGFFTPEERQRGERAISAELRAAIQEKGPDGVPFALPVPRRTKAAGGRL